MAFCGMAPPTAASAARADSDRQAGPGNYWNLEFGRYSDNREAEPFRHAKRSSRRWRPFLAWSSFS